MALPPPRRGQIWTLASQRLRRVVVYSGNMFNELPDVPYVITMDVVDQPDLLEVALPDGSRIAYTRLDHIPKADLGDVVGEVSVDLMSTVNTRLFMVITTP